jgi:hypothetical protein
VPTAVPTADRARWPLGSGPVPAPPASPSLRRTLLALVLPPLMILAMLLSAAVLYGIWQSRSDGVSALVPSRVTGPNPTTPPSSTSAAPTISPAPSGSSAGLPSPRPSTAHQQAAAIDALLDEAARTPVAAKVAALAGCAGTPADARDAVTRLTAAADARSSLLARLATIPVDALPGGSALAASLTDTWSQARDADRQYVIWAQGLADGSACNPQDPFKLAGDVGSAASRRAGTQFLDGWNATVAAPLHLSSRSVENL